MAPRLMRWAGWVLGGILVVALWALPPRAREDWFPGTSRPLFESAEEDRAFREITRHSFRTPFPLTPGRPWKKPFGANSRIRV